MSELWCIARETLNKRCKLVGKDLHLMFRLEHQPYQSLRCLHVVQLVSMYPTRRDPAFWSVECHFAGSAQAVIGCRQWVLQGLLLCS